MFNRSSLPQTIAPPLVEENSLLGKVRWRSVVELVRLPSTFAGYMAFLASLLVLAFTMALHVMLSAEIMQMEVQLNGMKEQYAHIERANANTVWEISQSSSMTKLNEIALASGYTTEIPVLYVDARSALSGYVMNRTGITPPTQTTNTDPAAEGSPGTGMAAAAGVEAGSHAVVGAESAADLPEYFTIPGSSGEPVEVFVGADGTGGNTVELTPGETSLPFTVDQLPAGNAADAGLAAGATGEVTTQGETEGWWQRAVPDWLRFNRIGDATGETMNWLRGRMPSGEWLRNNW